MQLFLSVSIMLQSLGPSLPVSKSRARIYGQQGLARKVQAKKGCLQAKTSVYLLHLYCLFLLFFLTGVSKSRARIYGQQGLARKVQAKKGCLQAKTSVYLLHLYCLFLLFFLTGQ